jgi:acetyl esterase/lipase
MRFHRHLALLLTVMLIPSAPAAVTPLPPIPLWPGGAPGALGTADKDIPTLTPFLPDRDKATGAAFVICPGGAYSGLAGYEGANYAQWLADHGIAGFVLKYRLGSGGYHHPSMLQDVSRALRLTRGKAAEWQLDPHRIGIMGSSAGGHLASTLLTHFDAGRPDDPDPIERQSSRPDLGVLCYAVITMKENTHGGSRLNLLGPTPSPELIHYLSSEEQVTADTPPCFIWHTWEDQTVKVENALAFAAALRAKGVHFELHIYEKGPHGLGLGKGGAPGGFHRWTSDLLAWLGERGWLAPGGAAKP